MSEELSLKAMAEHSRVSLQKFSSCDPQAPLGPELSLEAQPEVSPIDEHVQQGGDSVLTQLGSHSPNTDQLGRKW